MFIGAMFSENKIVNTNVYVKTSDVKESRKNRGYFHGVF